MSVYASSLAFLNFEPFFRPSMSFCPAHGGPPSAPSIVGSQAVESSLSANASSPGSFDERRFETNISINEVARGPNARDDLWRTR